ncbi:MAG: Hpt domain-containing protein [Treponema sp.]|nr:Hpt domain-containing protein [Treponema sp.]
MEKMILNTDAALEMLSGESELYKMLLDAFCNDCPKNLDAIFSYIREGKNEEARSYSHKIKGSASQIGAEQLTFALQYLEDCLKGNILGNPDALAQNADFVYRKTMSYITEFRTGI